MLSGFKKRTQTSFVRESLSQKLLKRALPVILRRFCAEYLADHESEVKKTENWQCHSSKFEKKAFLDTQNGPW